MIEGTADCFEDSAFQGQRADQLGPGGPAVLRLGWALVVDCPPEATEELLAHQPGQDPPDEAERHEEQLLHPAGPPQPLRAFLRYFRPPRSRPKTIPATKPAPAATGTGFSRAMSAARSAPLVAESGDTCLACPTSTSLLVEAVSLAPASFSFTVLLTSAALSLAWALTSVFWASDETVSPRSCRVASISSRTWPLSRWPSTPCSPWPDPSPMPRPPCCSP